MLMVRMLACAGLLVASAASLWAALRNRQRDTQIGAVAVAAASLVLVYFVLHKPVGLARPDLAPVNLEEEPEE